MAKAKSTPLRTRRPLINLISVGDTFGLLTVTDIRRDRRESLVCRCECGAEVRRNASQLLIKKEWRHVRCAIQTNQRFFDRIIRVPSGCWEFQSAQSDFGYRITCLYGKRGHAHRFSYAMFCGPIPEKMFVCHRCDNPACVHPAHLFVGTALDNNCDMIAKGRHLSEKRRALTDRHRGYGNPNAKLTDDDVRAIRSLATEGEKVAVIANRYGVHPGTVYGILRRKYRGEVA